MKYAKEIKRRITNFPKFARGMTVGAGLLIAAGVVYYYLGESWQVDILFYAALWTAVISFGLYIYGGILNSNNEEDT